MPSSKTLSQGPLTYPKTSLTTSNNAEKPISAGFYRLEAGKELVYPYTYDEMKIILEGSMLELCANSAGQFTITDETGYSVTAKPGDVFYFEKGTFLEMEN